MLTGGGEVNAEIDVSHDGDGKEGAWPVADLERFLALLEALRQSLATLDRYQQTVDRDRLLRDVDAQNMVLFALYRAVQGAIDLGQHLIAELGCPFRPHTVRSSGLLPMLVC
jgi:hypothetical protein